MHPTQICLKCYRRNSSKNHITCSNDITPTSQVGSWAVTAVNFFYALWTWTEKKISTYLKFQDKQYVNSPIKVWYRNPANIDFLGFNTEMEAVGLYIQVSCMRSETLNMIVDVLWSIMWSIINSTLILTMVSEYARSIYLYLYRTMRD